MTARPFVGWQRQANGRSVQQAIEEALARLTGEQPTIRGRRAHRRRRARARAGGACRSCSATGPADKLRDGAECASAAGAGRRPCGGGSRRMASTRASRRSAATTPTGSSSAARRRSLDRGRAWHVGRPLDAGAMHGAAQRLARHARLHHVPLHGMPGQEPGADARPARRVTRAAMSSSSRRRRARSCTTRCARWWAR